jgi:hypothetical protein
MHPCAPVVSIALLSVQAVRRRRGVATSTLYSFLNPLVCACVTVV